MKVAIRLFTASLLLFLASPTISWSVEADDVVCIKCVDTRDLNRRSVGTGKLKPSSVTTSKIADGAVTSDKLAPDAIDERSLSFLPELCELFTALGRDRPEVCPPLEYKTVFLTTRGEDGGFVRNSNLTGPEFADARCQSLADLSDLVPDGTYMAWLSDNSSSPSTRFTMNHGKGYARVDGVVVATSWLDLIDGTLQNPINVTEIGTVRNRNVYTGTNFDGTSSSSDNCRGWTDDDTDDVRMGASGEVSEAWSIDSGDDSQCDD